MMNGNGVVLMSPPSFIPREKELLVQHERILRQPKKIPMQKIDTVSIYGTEEQTPVEMIIYENGNGQLSGIEESYTTMQYPVKPSATDTTTPPSAPGSGSLSLAGVLQTLGTTAVSIVGGIQEMSAARRMAEIQREQQAQLAQQQAQLAAQQAAAAAQAQAQAMQQAAMQQGRPVGQAGLIPGISNKVLLIGGAGLAALLLFLRR